VRLISSSAAARLVQALVAALFFVSRLSRGITGEVLHVDGGFHVMGMAADVV